MATGLKTHTLETTEAAIVYDVQAAGATRDDPLLSDRSRAVSTYRPDFNTLAAAPTRIVIGVGEESQGTFTGRTSVATAARLGQQATDFPSHHGGFVAGDSPYAGQPKALACCAMSSHATTEFVR